MKLYYFFNGFCLLFALFIIYFGFNNFSYNGLSELLFHTDFFINYEGGFIRRGLDGEVFYLISKYYNYNLIIILKMYNLITFLGFIIVVAYWIYRYKIPLYIVFSLSSLLLYFTFINNGLRKDHIILTLFLITIYVGQLRTKKIIKYAIINTVLIVGILIHEILFIISYFPLLYILRANSKEKIRSINLNILPSILVFFVIILFFKGTIEVEAKIYQSLQAIGINQIKFNDGIFNSNLLIWEHLSVFAIIGLFATLIINYLYVKISVSNHKGYFSEDMFLITMQFLVCLLLCIVAVDYSRWIFFAVLTSLFAIYLNSENLKISRSNIINKKLFILTIVLYFFIGTQHTRWSIRTHLSATTIGKILYPIYFELKNN